MLISMSPKVRYALVEKMGPVNPLVKILVGVINRQAEEYPLMAKKQWFVLGIGAHGILQVYQELSVAQPTVAQNIFCRKSPHFGLVRAKEVTTRPKQS
jgi:ABC-type sugar transport system ATPase subunit